MDRRTVWAILLMMVIAIVPAIFLKRPPAPPVPAAGDTSAVAAPARAAAGSAVPGPAAAPTATDTLRRGADTAVQHPVVSTVAVTSPLYAYGVSMQGGRLVTARLTRHRSMAPEDSGRV